MKRRVEQAIIMSQSDPPYPESWDDLPEDAKLKVSREDWPKARKELIKLHGLEKAALDMADLFTKATVESEYLREKLSPILDAVRRLQTTIDSLSVEPDPEARNTRMKNAINGLNLETLRVLGGPRGSYRVFHAVSLDQWAAQPQETLCREIREHVADWSEGGRDEFLSQLTAAECAEVEEAKRKAQEDASE